MSDVINRDFAVMAIEQWLDHDGGWFDLGLKQAVREIKRLPSADRPSGKWKWDKDGIDWNIGAWRCSECGARNDNIPHSERVIPLRWSGSKFCPNCGARMKGADDERV